MLRALASLGGKTGRALALLVLSAVVWPSQAATDCQSYTQGDHNANPTCPSGQEPKWYYSVSGGGGPFADPGAASNAAATALGWNAYYWTVTRSGGGAYSGIDARAASIGAGGCPNLVSGPSLGVSHQCADIEDPCPANGTPYTGNKNFENAFGTTGYVQNGTRVCKVVGGGGVCMTVPAGSSKGTYCPQWTYTGEEGTVSSTAGSEPSETTENVCTSDGVCVSKTASNCGTVNGEYMCVGSPAPGGCLTTAKGMIVCTSNASTPLTTPPAPESPTTAGQVATPVAQFVNPNGTGGITNNNTTTNIFNPGGASAPGQVGTPSGTPTDEEGEGQGLCGGPGQPACASDIDCGGEGEPKCGVKVDETGTADAWSDLFSKMETAESDFESERTAVSEALTSQVSGSTPTTGWDVGAMIPDIPDNTCQTITVEFFNGDAKSFPPPVLCEAIEDTFKPVLAFFLYVATLLSILYSGLRSATGNT